MAPNFAISKTLFLSPVDSAMKFKETLYIITKIRDFP